MIPGSQRKCRDTFCCLLFALFWVGMIVIAGVAFDKGHPQRLLYGTDYQGKTCGTGELKARKYITYPRTAEDFIVNFGKKPQDMQVSVAGAQRSHAFVGRSRHATVDACTFLGRNAWLQVLVWCG